jgi:Kef-type K+ transport system membrane component KefB
VPLTTFELSVRLFLQLVVILAVCKGAAWVFRKAGQSQVVSEMVAGVLLGPSLLGWLWPAASAWLFPKESMPILFAFAQVGLVLYMFLVGLEFDPGLLRERFRGAALVSAAGIAAPFALGGLVAWATHTRTDLSLFGNDVPISQAVLYMGAAMSITAFPMLARIIHEQGLSRTTLGMLALAAGSLDDAAAWCLLAVVLAAFSGNASIALLAIGGGGVFLAFCLVVLRRLLVSLGTRVERSKEMSPALFSWVLMILMLGAFVTDSIGIYAVFGAFLTGAAMPKRLFSEELDKRIRPMTVSFLLPLFFVYSGLNTKLGLVSTPSIALLALVILVAACVGKGIACWAAARASGATSRDAVGIGTLMNARGLMELIILNIGLERGIIRPTLFTVMVVMAVVTTLAATPVFRRVYRAEEVRLPAGGLDFS